MKILIVEDEYVSRRKLEKILSPYFECVSVTTVDDAYSAFVEAIEKSSPFDFVSLDIVLPDGDGINLLMKIRKFEDELNIPTDRRAKVVMVTSHSDIAKVKECIKLGCNDFIVKPFEKEKILNKLKKFFPKDYPGDNKDILKDVAYKLKKGDLLVKPFSGVWMSLKDAISRGANISELSQIIKKDPAVCYKIIAVANSPIYRSVDKITSIEDAMVRIGLKEALNLIHNIYLKNEFLDKSKKGPFSKMLEQLWIHSVVVANLCMVTCEQLNIQLKEDPYLLGLFHDIGKFALIKAVVEVIERKGIQRDVSLKDMELLLKESHIEVGAALLLSHRFSAPYINVVRFHNRIEESPEISKDILVVNLANEIAKREGYLFGKQVPKSIDSIISLKMLSAEEHLSSILRKFKIVMENSSLV